MVLTVNYFEFTQISNNVAYKIYMIILHVNINNYIIYMSINHKCSNMHLGLTSQIPIMVSNFNKEYFCNGGSEVDFIDFVVIFEKKLIKYF